MCGIFGFSGNKAINIEKFKILGLYNIERGKDSSGHVCLYKGMFCYEKQLGEFSDYIEGIIDEDVFQNSRNYIGHTRAATKGAKTIENAHPFVHTNVAGVHNGTLEDYYYLLNHFKEKYKDEKEKIEELDKIPSGASDSVILYNLLNLFDKEEVISKYNGAAALMFLETNGTLNVYHDDKRPMFIGGVDGDYYFSSLEKSLKAINIHSSNIIELPTNTLYEYKNGLLISEKKIERSPLVRPAPTSSSQGNAGKNAGKREFLDLNENKTVKGIKINAFGEEIIVPLCRSNKINSQFKRNIYGKPFCLTTFKNTTTALFPLDSDEKDNLVVKRSMIYKKKDEEKIPVLLLIFDNGSVIELQINIKWYNYTYIPLLKKLIEEKGLRNTVDVNFLEIVYKKEQTFKKITNFDAFKPGPNGPSKIDIDAWGRGMNGFNYPTLFDEHKIYDDENLNVDNFVDEIDYGHDLHDMEVIEEKQVEDLFFVKLNGKYVSVYIGENMDNDFIKCFPLQEDYMLHANSSYIVCKSDSLMSLSDYYEEIADDLDFICNHLNKGNEKIGILETHYDYYITLEMVIGGMPKIAFFNSLLKMLEDIQITENPGEFYKKIEHARTFIKHQQSVSSKNYMEQIIKEITT